MQEESKRFSILFIDTVNWQMWFETTRVYGKEVCYIKFTHNDIFAIGEHVNTGIDIRELVNPGFIKHCFLLYQVLANDWSRELGY